MVLSGKLFLVLKNVSVEDLASRLRGYRVSEQPPPDVPQDFTFVTEVKGLEKRNGSLRGVLAYDSTIVVYQHGKTVTVPRTYEAPFLFTPYAGKLYLTVVAKKDRANALARRLNDVIFPDRSIVPLSVPPSVMNRAISERTENQVVTFFDGIQSVDKASLYGESLSDTPIYESYSKAGNIWYAVARSKQYGQVVGLGRNGVVVGFGMKDLDKFFDYVEGEVIPALNGG